MSAAPDKRRNPWRDDLAAGFMRGIVDVPRYVKGCEHRIASALAPIRQEPRNGAPQLTEALMGESFTVFDKRDEWVWGQLGSDGYVGYMHASHLTSKPLRPSHYVCTARSHVYGNADIKTTPLAMTGMMALVEVVATEGMFSRLADGRFMISKHLRALNDYEDDFVASAAQFINTPYLWGGRSGSGLDCSALVQLSLGACGIFAPRDSDMQEAELFIRLEQTPGYKNLRRGDLVFWPGHVAIMWSDNELLHANGYHMMTVIEPFDAALKRIVADIGPPRCCKRFENY